jgi:hypothetical protein
MGIRLWIHFWAALILLIPLGAQAVQNGAIDDPGDIAFVAYHDDDDGFSFLLMDDAPNGTSIRFTDEEWTGTAFDTPTGEGEVLWTNNTGSTITKGTVVDIVDADDNSAGIAPSVGTAVETDSGFGTANGDQMYAITGTRSTPGTFLAFVGESQDINGAETAVLTGTGLIAGTHAKLIATEGYYGGSTSCSSSLTACLQQINNGAWTGTAGFSYPSVVPNTFSGAVFVTDATPPVVNSITLSGSPASSATSVTFAVSFDENANSVSTDDFSVTTVSGSATGSVASVSASSGTSINVTVNSITGAGSIRLDLKASTNITDDAGNGNGTNGSVAAFSAGGTHTVAIPNSDGSLTASATVTEPVAINTTVDTVGEAINVFDFTLTDGGTTDGLAMTVSQIVVNVSGTSSDTNRANVTWRLNGSDASNATGTYNAGADTITFTGLSISIADGTSEVYTVNAYYNDNTGLTEGLTYILSVDGDTDVTVGAGTQMGATSAITNSTGSTVDVVATTLAFTTQPAGSVSGTALTTQPVVTARDAFGNTDTGFTETVTLTEASAGALSGNAVAAVSGVATFTALNYSATADQQSFTLTANDQDGVGSDLSTTNANAVTTDVVATKLVFTTQPVPLSVNSGEAKAFTTVPVVSAQDANNVIDTGYSTGIILAEVNGAGSATLTGTGDTDGSAATVTLTPSSGVSTFTSMSITYTASGGASENFNLQASSGGLSSANSSQLTGLVADSDGSLTAAGGVTEPVAIDTTLDTTGEAVNVFDFTLSDGGTADGNALTVSQIVLNVSGTASDTQRDNVTWRLSGNDASNVTGTYNAGADTITFTGLSISIADGASEVYTVNAYYNDNTGLTEGLTYILSVDGDTDVTVGAGTQMGATSAITNSTGSTVDVVATTLVFTTQPAGSVSGSALTTQPLVTARDAFGNTDTGFTETVTLTEASAGALSGNAVAAVSGVATFTALNYSATADQQSFTLTANDQDGVGSDLSTTNANAVTSDVVATKLVFDTQPAPLTLNSAVTEAMTTVPVVSARDANDVLDTGYTTGITLTETGAGSAIMSGTADTDGSSATVTITPTAGASTFSGLTINYTASGAAENFNLQASSGVLSTSNSSQFLANTDTVNPRISDIFRAIPTNSPTNVDSLTWTIAFNEVVNNFDVTDVEVTGTTATVQSITPIGSSVYRVTVSGGDLATLNGTAILAIASGHNIADEAGNALTNLVPTVQNVNTFVVDNNEPTVAISGVSANSNAAFTATFTFSEAVTGFDATDITLGNATKGTFTATSSTVYTLVVTPTGAAVTIDVAANSAIDVASNGNTAATQASSAFDNAAPTVAISGVPANSNAAFTATFTFSEAVTGFDATDITLANATKGTFTATSSTIYTLVVTPTGAAVTVDVAANGAIDIASNGNTAAIQATTNYDATDPAVVISGVPADTNTAFTATFTFSEAVTGFDATDITLGNATKGTFVATSSTVYTLVVTPTGAAVTVDVAANRAIDVASNGNTAATQASSAFDNEAPTFAIGAPSVTTTRNGPVTYTLNYANADNITLALNNITLNKTGDADGTLALSGTDNSRTVTISDISGDGTLAISIAANSANDKAGNTAAAANSATVTVVSNQMGTLSISGNTVVGETLTANLADVDGLTDITVAYQWTSGGNNVGTSVDSYLLQASDVGKSISVNAQYTDQRGTAENINSSASDIVITTQSDAVNRISSTANQSGGTEPTVDDYKTAGISDVPDVILTRILPLINNAVARQSDSADVDDVTKLQALVDTILEGQDDDGDGLPNLVEGTEDTDKDGTTDREDTDSDNDGVADQLEVRLALTDSDSDGIIDVLDADVGNDGQVDTDKVDANFDGVDDALDSMAKLLAKSHANAQAIPAVADEAELSFIQFDQDQDQRPNHLDLDSDNDGVMDVVESGLSDINGDGKLDAGDTVITDGSQLLDGDADSLPNMLELKSDGISFDLIVNGLPETLDKDANGILDSTIDMDRDGIIDSVDNAVGAQGTLPDMDGDGIPNHADDDDDGDGILDVDENSQQQYFTGLDADADGIDDGVDQNINGVLEGTDANNNGVRDDRELADLDGDGIADYLDTDSDNDGVLDGQDIIVNVGYDVKSRGTGEMSIMMMLSLLLLSTFRYSRNIFRISTVLLLFLVTGVSHAQSWQVSLGLGQSVLRPDLASGLDTRDGSDWAVQLGVGYRILPEWHVELRYSDLGDADIRGDQGRSALGYQTWVLDAKYQLPLLQGTAWSPYILGGIAVNRLRAEDLKLEKKTDPSLMFGTGISYRFQEFKLNSELIRYSYDNAGWFIGIEKDF